MPQAEKLLFVVARSTHLPLASSSSTLRRISNHPIALELASFGQVQFRISPQSLFRNSTSTI